MLIHLFCEGGSLSYVQTQREVGLSVPSRISSHLLLEEVLLWLPHTHLQGQHSWYHPEDWFVAVSLHSQGLQVQELLHQSKGTVQHPGNRSELLSLYKPKEQGEARGWWGDGVRRRVEYALPAQVEIQEVDRLQRATDQQSQHQLPQTDRGGD